MTIPSHSDAVLFGILATILGIVFYTASSEHRFWRKFYRVVPVVLMCYLLPSLLNTFGIVSFAGSNLWGMAKDYFLPASLILMTLSIDLKGVLGLGNKALAMFFTATIGIVLGGPVAVYIMSLIDPGTVGGAGSDAVWRGLSTLAGSWIGGGANQTAMLELYGFNPEKYAIMVAVDIIVANLWMACLLYGAGKPERIDRWLRADTSAIESLQRKMSDYSRSIERKTNLADLMMMTAVAFGGVGLSHLVAQSATQAVAHSTSLQASILANNFFWVVVTSTSLGLTLSFTRLRQLEGAGASKLGSVFIFLLIAIVGTKMDLSQLSENTYLMFVGILWMLFHIGLLVIVAKLIRAPFFFLAVGSKANVGGAASAPIVAAAFHPTLAPVGVLLAVLGYALGTYGAIICAQLMQLVAPP